MQVIIKKRVLFIFTRNSDLYSIKGDYTYPLLKYFIFLSSILFQQGLSKWAIKSFPVRDFLRVKEWNNVERFQSQGCQNHLEIISIFVANAFLVSGESILCSEWMWELGSPNHFLWLVKDRCGIKSSSPE